MKYAHYMRAVGKGLTTLRHQQLYFELIGAGFKQYGHTWYERCIKGVTSVILKLLSKRDDPQIIGSIALLYSPKTSRL